MIKVSVGDKIRVWKFVYDTDYNTEGIVEKVEPSNNRGNQSLYVNGDWWGNANDHQNKCTVLKYADGRLTWAQELEKLANQYSTTVERIKNEYVTFGTNEGYLDNGYECSDFDEWLEKRFAARKHRTTEPYQKGDLGYGL